MRLLRVHWSEKHEPLIDSISMVHTVHLPRHRSTNSVVSIHSCRHLVLSIATFQSGLPAQHLTGLTKSVERPCVFTCLQPPHSTPYLGRPRPCSRADGVYLLNSTTIVVAWLLTNDEITRPHHSPRKHACKEDEATQYLAAYKQSEHRPPTLICERISKTPAVLRTVFTSTPRLNRTNFEALRASLLRPDPCTSQISNPLSPVFISPPPYLPRFGLKRSPG
ncbi:hypothetical protein EDB89DRAFT_375195 [Lactarius sanguifluus]|nr:hypothetical protein EDB89DRAFT_375195 [Lactarius sanguifluus]